MESRKQAISIRMSSSDVRKVKKLSQRLGVRDSDVIRFAVKGMLARLGPLHDVEVRGRNLLPVFVESGLELLRFFELDAARLEAIINEGVESGRRVERDDIELLALTGVPEPYAALKLGELNQQGLGRPDAGQLFAVLRQYLYEKYVYRNNSAEPLSGEPARLAVVGGGHHG